jgi:hypothetical protein
VATVVYWGGEGGFRRNRAGELQLIVPQLRIGDWATKKLLWRDAAWAPRAAAAREGREGDGRKARDWGEGGGAGGMRILCRK